MGFFQNIIHYIEPYLRFPDIIFNILDIVILTFLIYKLLKFIFKTTAEQVLKGLAIVLVVTWITSLLGLTTINWILKNALSVGVIAIIILFQPELRRGLEKFGRKSIVGLFVFKTPEIEVPTAVNDIVSVAQELSRQRLGAIIVIEKVTGLQEYIERSIPIDGVLSEELLLNIFTHNAPLHDGAVIVRGNRIVAAGCVLPLTQNPFLSSQLGTRHRAAIGITEVTDALSVVVSEETGYISIVENGKIFRNIDADRLRNKLTEVFQPKTVEKKTFITTVKEKLNRGTK
ncbi:MAG: TIGR00159 family protein [Clostridiales bacterium]|nr:TIGR00159 family protein [Clostridiales bacterium]